jgi:hypothetical protein
LKDQVSPVNKLVIWILICTVIITGCASPTATIEIVVPIPTAVVEASQTQLIIPTLQLTATLAPTLALVGTPTLSADHTAEARLAADAIEYEMKGSFDFFWEQANADINSPGFGLIRDRYPGSEGIASTASIGFGLTACLIGIEKGYITKQEGYERVYGTLDTLLSLERTEGFFFHFLDMKTGKRAWNSEISSIDTAILLMGVLSAAEYFGGDVETKAHQIYNDVNWPWFIDESKNMFYMAYRPEKGFEGHWDFYAEQLMLYVLAAGSDTHPIDDTAYYGFTRHYGRYGDGNKFIHSWFGSIFTYQYSHAWIDFRGYTDKKGVNWFDNSVDASLAQVSFAIDEQGKYKTLSPLAWGLTACDGPDGYNGTYGAPPSGYDNNSHLIDDTIPPAGAIGSIIFVPQQSLVALINYYSIDKLKGPYGFVDAYNLSEEWYATDVIGIDKGISLLMLANYQDDVVYKITMENKIILNGLAQLQITVNQ